MELKEVFAALEAAENGAAMVEAIKSELAGVRKEAADARISKNKAEGDLAALKAQHDDLAAKHKELETKLAASEETKTGAQSAMQKLETQMANLTKKYEEAEAARKSAEEKRVQADIMAQTVDAFTKSNAVDPQEFAKLVAPSIKVADDGSYRYTKADGTDGTIADGAAEWLKDKAWRSCGARLSGYGHRPVCRTDSRGHTSAHDFP